MYKTRFKSVLYMLLSTLLFLTLVIIFPTFIYASNPIKVKTDISLTTSEKEWLNRKVVVRIGVANWPPYIIMKKTDSEVDAEGIAIEYIESIFSYHNIEYEFVHIEPFTLANALKNIESKKDIDLIPTVNKTKDREKYLSFTQYYQTSPWVIFTREDANFITSLADLHEKKIAIPSGYVILDLIKNYYPSIEIIEVSGDNMVSTALKKVALLEADAFVGNLLVGSYTINREGYSNIKVAAPTPFENHDLAMGIRNDWPELTSIIDKTLNTFSISDHNQIRGKYLNIRYEHGLRLSDILKWILILSIVFGIIIFFILRWNKELNKEIAARKAAEKNNLDMIEKLENLSKKDPLTNLLNSRAFLEELEKRCNSKSFNDSHFLYCFIDLDDFKKINDRFGHPVGDLALIHFSKIITSFFPKIATIGRLGGEEFGLILRLDKNNNEKHMLLAFLSKLNTEELEIDESIFIKLYASIGCAYSYECNYKPYEIHKLADSRMYKAKKEGKNKIVIT